MVKSVVDKALRIGDISILLSYMQELPMGIYTKFFDCLAFFCMELFFSVIFCFGSARNERYYARFVAFIRFRFVVHKPFKKASKAALTSGVNAGTGS